jgi:hypothetical protein
VSEINAADPDGEFRKFDQFLKDHPSQRAIVDSIYNVAQPDGEAAAGHLRLAFPTSAFGRAEQREGGDIPARPEAPPLGLLDPLLALVNRRNALDAVRLEQDLAAHSRLVDILTFPRLWRLRKKAKRLINRSPSSEPATRARSVINQSWMRVVLACMVWFIAIDYLRGGYRSLQFRTHVGIVTDPHSTEVDLLAARKWFDAYKLSGWKGIGWPWMRLPSEADVNSIIGEIDDKSDELAYGPYQQAKDEVARFQAAQEYLKKYSVAGRHSTELYSFVTQQDLLQKRRQVDQNLDIWDQHLATLGAADVEKAYSTVAAGLPLKHVATPEQISRYQAILARYAARLVEVNQGNLVSSLAALIKKADFENAAKALVNAKSRDTHWEGVVADFSTQILAELHARVGLWKRDRKYDDARNTVKNARNSLHQLEIAIRPTHHALAETILKAQPSLGEIGTSLEEDEEHFRYDQILQSPASLDKVQAYLSRFPGGLMSKEVEMLKASLDQREKPLDVVVSALIVWDPGYSNFSGSTEDDHLLTVKVDHKTVLQVGNLTGAPGQASGIVGTFNIPKRRLGESVNVDVQLIEQDPLWNDDAGSGNKSMSLGDLEKHGQVISLPIKNTNVTNSLVLRAVGGIPPKPELPPWPTQSSSQ